MSLSVGMSTPLIVTHCDFGLKESLDGVSHATHNLCHKQSIGTVIQDCTGKKVRPGVTVKLQVAKEQSGCAGHSQLK